VRQRITGSAVALHGCKAYAKINRKMGNSTPCKIGTPESIILKLCTRDYVGEMTHHANFGFNRCSGGFSPNMPNVTILWLFWRSLPFFLDPAPRSNRWTDFHALWLKRRVSAQGWSFWGLKRWVTIFGEICPNLPPPMGVNRQFQARTAKFKNRNISKTINRIKTKFEDRADTNNCTSWVV